MKEIMKALKGRARKLKEDITALYYAYKKGHLSWPLKGLIWFTLGYAISPIDLIPDFIPILGYLDDVILLPGLIVLCVKCIPKAIMVEARAEAKRKPIQIPKNMFVTVGIVLIWLLIIYGLVGLWL